MRPKPLPRLGCCEAYQGPEHKAFESSQGYGRSPDHQPRGLEVITIRTLLNGTPGEGLTSSFSDKLAWKIWSPTHVELEVRLPHLRRYPVVHCLLRDDRKAIVAGSFQRRLDFVLQLSLYQFMNLGDTYPKTAQLFHNTFAGVRDDAFLTRAIEPYSEEIHWFLVGECPWRGKGEFQPDAMPGVIEDNEEMVQRALQVVKLVDVLYDDLQISTAQAIWRNIKSQNRKIVGSLVGHAAGSLAETPRFIEFLTRVNEWGEKIEAWEDRFCIERDLYYAFIE